MCLKHCNYFLRTNGFTERELLGNEKSWIASVKKRMFKGIRAEGTLFAIFFLMYYICQVILKDVRIPCQC